MGFVCRWLEKNLPNLIMPLHRFCVHTLTTVYRTIEAESGAAAATVSTITTKENPLSVALNKELRKLNEATVERRNHEIITGNTLTNTSGLGNLMSLSQSWLLAAALPNVFTRFQEKKTPAAQPQLKDSEKLDAAEGSTVIPSPIDTTPATPSISHLMFTIPTHWSLLYDSQQHGVGSNRFLHHVIGYKGPTLVLLHSETDEVFCLASPSEWRETHLYTGADDCHIIQLLPK